MGLRPALLQVLSGLVQSFGELLFAVLVVDGPAGVDLVDDVTAETPRREPFDDLPGVLIALSCVHRKSLADRANADGATVAGRAVAGSIDPADQGVVSGSCRKSPRWTGRTLSMTRP